NQLTGVTVGGDTTTYGYDANGNIVNKTTGALVTTYYYNEGNMLLGMNTKQGTTTINGYDADYFLDGNLKQKRENGNDTYYQYNGLGQLIVDRAFRFNNEGECSYEQYFTYDAYGNRSRLEFRSPCGENYQTTYQYNANNQLLQEQRYDKEGIEEELPYSYNYTYSYTYDANGNQRYRTVQTASEEAKWGNEGIGLSLLGEEIEQYGNTAAVEMYSYNGFGQMTQAVVDGTTAAYAYNPDGLRISKTVNGETTKHILDGANVVADIKGGAVSKYNRGRGLISIEQNGSKGYYTFNGHGDVIGIVDGNGSLTNKTQFYAFGGEIYQESTVFDNPFGYAGEYTDEETGNIYYWSIIGLS
ncbi:MAG: hypothetical protein HFI90_02205, partial [Clostridia bacterium]|nr:hypothetical protein [Clostridia bacterium]